MEKQHLINLVCYHMEKNAEAFVSEVVKTARDYEEAGDLSVADHLMNLISSEGGYVTYMTIIQNDTYGWFRADALPPAYPISLLRGALVP